MAKNGQTHFKNPLVIFHHYAWEDLIWNTEFIQTLRTLSQLISGVKIKGTLKLHF